MQMSTPIKLYGDKTLERTAKLIAETQAKAKDIEERNKEIATQRLKQERSTQLSSANIRKDFKKAVDDYITYLDTQYKDLIDAKEFTYDTIKNDTKFNSFMDTIMRLKSKTSGNYQINHLRPLFSLETSNGPFKPSIRKLQLTLAVIDTLDDNHKDNKLKNTLENILNRSSGVLLSNDVMDHFKENEDDLIQFKLYHGNEHNLTFEPKYSKLEENYIVYNNTALDPSQISSKIEAKNKANEAIKQAKQSIKESQVQTDNAIAAVNTKINEHEKYITKQLDLIKECEEEIAQNKARRDEITKRMERGEIEYGKGDDGRNKEQLNIDRNISKLEREIKTYQSNIDVTKEQIKDLLAKIDEEESTLNELKDKVNEDLRTNLTPAYREANAALRAQNDLLQAQRRLQRATAEAAEIPEEADPTITEEDIKQATQAINVPRADALPPRQATAKKFMRTFDLGPRQPLTINPLIYRHAN